MKTSGFFAKQNSDFWFFWDTLLTSDHRLMTLLPARECHRPMMPQERSDEQIHNQSAHNQDGHSDKQSKWGWQKLVYNCEESYYPSVRLTSCLHWYPVNKNYISGPSINSFVEHINIKTASIFIWAKKLHICMWSEKKTCLCLVLFTFAWVIL